MEFCVTGWETGIGTVEQDFGKMIPAGLKGVR